MSFEDDSPTQENVCYKKLNVNRAIVANEEDSIELKPFIQPIMVNATINVNQNIAPAPAAAPVAQVSQQQEQDRAERKSARIKNIVAGSVMLLVSVVILLPFIFALDGISAKMVDLYALMPALDFTGNLNAVQNTIILFTNIKEIATIWKSSTPGVLLALGLLFVVFNIIKAFVGLIGGVKGRKYIINALVTTGFFGIVIVLQLFGIDMVGLPKINFVADVIFNWKYSPNFILMLFALLNIIAACICAVFVPSIPKKNMD